MAYFMNPFVLDVALIKALRAHFKMSQLDVAHAAGLSVPTIYKLESGDELYPRLSTLNGLAAVFNCSPTQLLLRTGPITTNEAVVDKIKSELPRP